MKDYRIVVNMVDHEIPFFVQVREYYFNKLPGFWANIARYHTFEDCQQLITSLPGKYVGAFFEDGSKYSLAEFTRRDKEIQQMIEENNFIEDEIKNQAKMEEARRREAIQAKLDEKSKELKQDKDFSAPPASKSINEFKIVVDYEFDKPFQCFYKGTALRLLGNAWRKFNAFSTHQSALMFVSGYNGRYIGTFLKDGTPVAANEVLKKPVEVIRTDEGEAVKMDDIKGTKQENDDDYNANDSRNRYRRSKGLPDELSEIKSEVEVIKRPRQRKG